MVIRFLIFCGCNSYLQDTSIRRPFAVCIVCWRTIEHFRKSTERFYHWPWPMTLTFNHNSQANWPI